MIRYIDLWFMMAKFTVSIAFQSRFGTIIFLIGKLIRFLFFFFFLIFLVSKTKTIAGYGIWEVIFFYATFNLIDTIPQFLMRETYRFRWYVSNGYFDHILLKPLSPLFRSLFGGSDPLDIPMVILAIALIVYSALHLGTITFLSSLLYILLVCNAFIIAASFHIFVLSIGIMTTEVDNTIMLYRDVTQMGRLPIDIYKEPLRGVLTFLVPVGIMMTFPAKAFMGLLTFQIVVISLIVGFVALLLSILFWKYALRQYASASS